MRGIKTCLVAFVFAVLTAFPASADIVYVNAPSGLNLRQLPTVNSKSMQVLPYGTKLVIIDDEPLNGWLMVEGGGYVKGEFTQPEDPQDDMELLGTWRITAYAWTGNPCANGNYPTTGYTIACNSLPFGTQIYVEDVGIRVVEDRGPAYLGSEWCDLYLGDYNSCVQWGSQQKRVWRIK